VCTKSILESGITCVFILETSKKAEKNTVIIYFNPDEYHLVQYVIACLCRLSFNDRSCSVHRCFRFE
jgi:hypothetical protein